jgi:hypothetical protein
MPRRIADISDFFNIDGGDEIEVGGRFYKITGHEKERRFGIEDPKFWVKRAIDLENGARKIIKFAFFESFEITLGGVKIRCYRNPEKEGEILEFMRGHPLFMQGEVFRDHKENNIRVLDIVRGTNLYVKLDNLVIDHQTYFETVMPDLLRDLLPTLGAIRELHMRGYRHGDIRSDHILIEHSTKNMVWIDFDYDYEAPENPFGLDLLGLGNILLYVLGKGYHDLYTIAGGGGLYEGLIDRVDARDFSILDKSRLMNLKKLYPYIPEQLNDILLHFSKGSNVFYEVIDEFLEDLNKAVDAYCYS